MATTGRVRQAIRWLLWHGLLTFTTRRRIRSGDLGARLMLDDELAADPVDAYDALRRAGRIVDGGLVAHTAHHDLATAILRSPDFVVLGRSTDNAPPWMRLLARLGGPPPRARSTRRR